MRIVFPWRSFSSVFAFESKHDLALFFLEVSKVTSMCETLGWST